MVALVPLWVGRKLASSLCSPTREDTRRSLLPQSAKGPPPEADRAGTRTSDFPPAQLREVNTCCFQVPCPWLLATDLKTPQPQAQGTPQGWPCWQHLYRGNRKRCTVHPSPWSQGAERGCRHSPQKPLFEDPLLPAPGAARTWVHFIGHRRPFSCTSLGASGSSQARSTIFSREFCGPRSLSQCARGYAASLPREGSVGPAKTPARPGRA